MRTGALETQLSLDAALERAEDWSERAKTWLQRLNPGSRLTAETLRLHVGPPPAHGDACGAVIRGASRSGVIRAVGFTSSTRPDAHGRLLRVWQRTDERNL